MRYAIIPKGLSINEVETECRLSGGRNIRVAHMSEQVFAELDDAGVQRLQGISGLVVKKITKTRADQLRLQPYVGAKYEVCQPIYGSSLATIWSGFYDFREMFSPPLTGAGLVTAVLDSGIRKTHRSLVDKVTYEANFTDSPDCDDHFDHGTGVAYLVAGGRHALGEEAGMAPGARVMNIKVIGDDGEGTVEDAVMGMNEVHDLFCEAVYGELPLGDPMYPNAVNMSFGTEDDGDPDNPLRLAIEKLYQASPGKFPIFCAAGNTGGPVLLPAAAEHAWAVGAVNFSPFSLWENSNRGCKIESVIKPELVFYGINILMASSASDDAMVAKSGTSFASPLALGQLCLMREAADRFGVQDWLIGRTYEELEQLVALMCVKPEDVPLGKTNDWGYGFPLGNLMARQFGIGASPSQTLTQAMPALAMAMGMAAVMKAV
ncbi:MAG: S8 family serine peptidase [Chloroflexota bacterium]